MEPEQDDRIEADPKLIAEMKTKAEAVYKAFQQAHQAMRSASRAIDELQAVIPQELSTFGPPPTSGVNRKSIKSSVKQSGRHIPYNKPNLLPAPQSSPATNMATTMIVQTKRSRGGGARSPGRQPSSTGTTGSSRREPPEFTPEQAELLDEFIKYFNLRVEGTNIPQWKIGAEISEFAGNSIKMDQSTVSRMARRLGVPKSQTGVDAVKRWIANEKQKIAAAKTNAPPTQSPSAMEGVTTTSTLVASGTQQPPAQQQQPQQQQQQTPPSQQQQQQQQPPSDVAATQNKE